MKVFVVMRVEDFQEDKYETFACVEGIYSDYGKALEKYNELKKGLIELTNNYDIKEYIKGEKIDKLFQCHTHHCLINDYDELCHSEIQLVIREIQE